MLSHLFTTPILHQRVELPGDELAQINAYLHELRTQTTGEVVSNRGGWHSSGNLFDPAEHRTFPGFTQVVTEAVLRYFQAIAGFEGEVHFRIAGWAVMNRAGDVNAPHTHPGNLVSGVFYPQIPAGMSGGEIVFMDPRQNVNAQNTDGMRAVGLKPAWDNPTVAHRPQLGDLILFPSWLYHYVQAFTAEDPQATRTVIAFNIAV